MLGLGILEGNLSLVVPTEVGRELDLIILLFGSRDSEFLIAFEVGQVGGDFESHITGMLVLELNHLRDLLFCLASDRQMVCRHRLLGDASQGVLVTVHSDWVVDLQATLSLGKIDWTVG